MTVVIGTAGHIDHGKTTLLRALTGIDADRLPEEQRRGMTIDVGYAHLDLDDGTSIDFVDVPGHDALIGNMLVGAGEIDAAMLVVAADDGPRAQTIEHLALLDALGIAHGLAVITKADVAGEARAAAVADEVGELLVGTSLAGAPVLVASALSGVGLQAVRAAIVRLRDTAPGAGAGGAGSGGEAGDAGSRRGAAGSRGGDAESRGGDAESRGRPAGPRRLAVDRAFAVRGRGWVVTGTLRDGAIRTGETLRVEPGGLEVRVRGLQVHHATVEVAGGGRVAVNVAGAGVGQLSRGAVLTSGPGIEAADRLLVSLAPPLDPGPRWRGPRALAWPPVDGSSLRLHIGTAQVDAIVGRRGREAVTLPDGRVSAILRLAEPVPTFAGDRAVLRRPSPGDVAAGVRVLDAHPARGISRRRATPERVAALALAVDHGDREVAVRARAALHGVLLTPAAYMLAQDVREALEAVALDLVATHHRSEPASPGLPIAAIRDGVRAALRRLATVRREDSAAADASIASLIDNLLASGRLAREGERLRDPSRAAGPPAALVAAMDRLERLLDVAAPPDLSEAARAAGCPAAGIRALEAAGRIVRVEADLAWAAPAFQRLCATALALASHGPLAPAALRDATGTSRRVVMPLLEDLNRRGILVRTPAGHVPGPRAPREPVRSP